MAATVDSALAEIKAIQSDARASGFRQRPMWPMIVLRTPKGWTGPKIVDGLAVEGSYRAHQVPVAEPRTNPEHLKILEDWMKSYHADELFDQNGRLIPELAELAPTGTRRHGQLLDQAREDPAAFRVKSAFLMLDRSPLGMAGHG